MAGSLEELVAKCLAAISNRNTIASRSLLTGELEYMTLQVQAVFRNGSSPSTIRDWQRLSAGLFRRSLGMDDFKFGRMSMARLEGDPNLVLLLDVDYEVGLAVLERLQGAEGDGAEGEQGSGETDSSSNRESGRVRAQLPSGVRVTRCETLPALVQDRSERPAYSSYGSSGGGGGGYRGTGGYGGGRSSQG